MNGNNNVLEYLIEDANKKDKQLTELNKKLKFYKVYSLITSILLIILLIVALVKFDLDRLLALFVFAFIFVLIYPILWYTKNDFIL